jgi:hypothetical protein
MPQKEASAWAPVDAVVPGDTPTPLSALRGALKRITSGGGQAQGMIDKLTPALPKALLKELENVPGSLSGADFTWDEARKLRSAIGNALRNPKIANDIGNDNLKALYAATTQDMRAATKGIDAQNPQAGATDAFDAANNESTRLNNFAQNVVGKAISSENPGMEKITPAQAANAMLAPAKKGGSPLASLRSEIPDAADALAAAYLRKLGLEDANEPASAAHGKFPARWQSLSPEAKAALYPDPTMRAVIDAQARIGSLLDEAGGTPAPSSAWGHALAGGTIGNALGALGTGAWDYLTGHGLSAGDELMASAAGEALGFAAPAMARMTKFKLANSPLIARYSAGARPDYLLGPSGDTFLAGLSGGVPNDLSPQKGKK